MPQRSLIWMPATIKNYWARLSKVAWFVSGERINYLPKRKAEANNWSARHWQITIFWDKRLTELNNVLSFGHRSFDQLNMSNHSLPARGTDLPFSHESVVSITHEQNIICIKTLICRQLFAGHVVGSRPMKRTEKIHRLIISVEGWFNREL